jgi:hypothetical protein
MAIQGRFKRTQFIVATFAWVAISACSSGNQQESGIPGENLVTRENCTQPTKLGPFKAYCGAGGSTLQPITSVAAKNFLAELSKNPGKTYTGSGPKGTDAQAPRSEDHVNPTPPGDGGSAVELSIGYPIDLLGEQSIFGAVITKVSDRENEKLGGLKMTDLTPLHVKTLIANIGGNPALALVGCASECTENSQQDLLVAIPVTAIDTANNLLVLDLAALGPELDLVTMLDPEGEYTGLEAVDSRTTALDFSLSTLIFDVETKFVPKPPAAPAPGAAPAPAPAAAPETTFTVRWYLKLGSGFNPAFVSRTPTEEVGFFTTSRAKDTKITRFAATDFGTAKGVHYYIKNVPAEWQAAFRSAFDEWNTKFETVVGRKLLSYEFVPEGDPRNEALVAGDIRYNILEWDLVNKASYGGLGPSIANQFTGETFAAFTLIQGPSVIALYTDWFASAKKAEELVARGRLADAELAMLEFHLRLAAKKQAEESKPKFDLRLGARKLAFRVVSQLPELQDPLAQRNDFDETPDGFDYPTYMNGYFRDMVAHELGHNLGLRHNFRGNLGDDDSGREGTVSRSIMEYLNRKYRYLDHIGPYDQMAIAFGYTGRAPAEKSWFCTDEENAAAGKPELSAECQRDDASSDPFSFFEQRLTRSIDKLLARGSSEAPVWKLEDMARELGIAIAGLNAYAASAEETSSKWTNFFGKPGRPADAAGVKPFVLAHIKAQLCDPNLEFVIREKRNQEARDKTRAALEALRKKVAADSKTWETFSADDLACR